MSRFFLSLVKSTIIRSRNIPMQKIPTISIRRSGKRSAPAILFLHGFMGDAWDWEAVVNLLESDFQCFLVDLPGHGRNRSPEVGVSWSMENTARAVVYTLDNAGISSCFLIGYSMGGRLALYLALKHPRYFQKVILEGASPGIRHPDERRQRRELDEKRAERLENSDFRTFLREWYRQPLFQGLPENDAFPNMLQRRLRNNPHHLAKVLRELGTGAQPSLWNELPEVKIPLLLMVGEKDKKFRAIAEEMCQTSSRIRMAVIPGCGHNVHVEAPQLFTKQVKRFFFKG